jgi:hypothetical protein
VRDRLNHLVRINTIEQVSLTQLIRFLVVKLIHLNLNSRFDMNVVFMTNYFLVGVDIPIDSKSLFMIDFINLKIKLIQSFRCCHKNRVCMYFFIEISAHIYIYEYLYLYYFF